ncbi:rhodanese-like domain-containing protein [candidate division WWE3 bacterium]|nr:rhodanese-like domain-containing protein [candidate division WWE3 bacterium]
MVAVILAVGGAIMWYWTQQNPTSPTPTVDVIDRSVEMFSKQYPELANETYSIDNPALIFDIREKADYTAGHLKGALPLPYSAIQSGDFQIPTDRRIIIVVGRSQFNKTVLKKELAVKGISQIELISEPYENWSSQFDKESGNPIPGDEENVE